MAEGITMILMRGSGIRSRVLHSQHCILKEIELFGTPPPPQKQQQQKQVKKACFQPPKATKQGTCRKDTTIPLWIVIICNHIHTTIPYMLHQLYSVTPITSTLRHGGKNVKRCRDCNPFLHCNRFGCLFGLHPYMFYHCYSVPHVEAG